MVPLLSARPQGACTPVLSVATASPSCEPVLCEQGAQSVPGLPAHLLGHVSLSHHVLFPQDCSAELLTNRLLGQATLQPTAAPAASPGSCLQEEASFPEGAMTQDTPSLLFEYPKVWAPQRVGNCCLRRKLTQKALGLPASCIPQAGGSSREVHCLRWRCSGKRLRVPGASWVLSVLAPLSTQGALGVHRCLRPASLELLTGREWSLCSHTTTGC